MSVTISGVKGYEYQYKVTVLVALTINADKVNLFVEKEGHEDALLIVEKNGNRLDIEIQVKRENNPISIAKIVKWLSHFQERKPNNNLLQKLIDNKQTIALFVTHSRCSDNTVSLKKDFFFFEKHNTVSLLKRQFDEFKKVLKNIKFGNTELMQQRENFCQKQAETFKNTDDLNTILERCLIFEEFTDEKVDKHITSLLNAKYSIAQSKTNDVYLQLLEIVKHGRDSGEEIANAIHRHIQLNRIGIPIIDAHYKTRKEESHLIEELSKKGVLLLTGMSQCGKTELAKNIANYFVNKGYNYQIYDDISQLKRFFKSNVFDQKIAILEDPFGHISLTENYLDILHRLKEVLVNRERHHFLIVSSRLEIVYDTFDTTSIERCKIKNYAWHDLTIRSNETVVTFWESIVKDKSISSEIINLVRRGILDTQSENLLQIGQLTYLVNEEIDLLIHKSFSDLEHIARRNSVEIAQNLKQSDNYAADILSLICICSTPIHKLLLSDLAYILSEAEELTSIRKNPDYRNAFGNNKIPLFPKYPSSLVLSQEALNAVNYLEERGFIYLSKGSLIITHPNYYEAGRHLFFERGSLKQQKKIKRFKKCLACLSTITAYQASKNFAFVHDKIRKDFKKETFNLAFLGLNSIFPSVKDNSLIFLSNFISEIDEKQYSTLVNTIKIGSDSNIYWHKNIPFISNQGSISNFSFFTKKDLAIISKVKRQLSDKTLPTVYDAWVYITGIPNRQETSLENIRLLFQFNEAFIREKVVYYLFNSPNILDKEIISEVFNDEHPTVVFSVIRASLLNWFLLSIELKSVILELAYNSLKKKQVAIRAFNLISTFSIDYGGESIFRRDFNEVQKKEIWQIWGKLYPICVDSVPLDIQINSGRFSRTMDDSIKHLGLETGMIILNAWYKRIDYEIKNNKTLDEREMSIAKILMKLTTNNFEIRKELFSKLVDYNNTIFLLSNLKWLLGFGSVLHKTEKEKIINLVKSNREDLRWIKAVILNSYSSLPKELTQSILGIDKLDCLKVKDIIPLFPNQLLKDCLNVYCGFPQPLWWLAVHHQNSKFWGKVIRHIFEDENNIGFEICLQEFLSHGVNSFGRNWKDWEIVWTKLCKTIVNKQLLVESLIYNTAISTCNLYYTNKLWSILIDSYKKIKRENKIIELVSKNIELLQKGYKKDCLRIFPKEFLTKVFKKLKTDYLIYESLKIVEDSPELKQKVINKLDNIDFKKKNVRLFFTFDCINDFIKNDTIPEVLKIKLKSIPNLIDEIGERQLKKFKNIEEYKLENWIGIN